MYSNVEPIGTPLANLVTSMFFLSNLEEIKLEFEKDEAGVVETIYNEITGSRM